MGRVAVYPGSFDPVTKGHLDVIKRSSRIFDRLIVTVFANPQKSPLFTMQERVQLIEEATAGMDMVEVDSFRGLLVRYMKARSATVIVKGLRAVSDFEYEFQMASMNKKLDPEIETIFMMTSTKYAYLSSSVVKEVAKFGGCIQDLVPDNVVRALSTKYDFSREGDPG